MSISGTTNTCQILTNTQFVLSGLSQTNLSTINITDINGLDVSECFGIETNIITVVGDNVVLSGKCDTSLEITITEGTVKPVECSFTGFTQDQTSGLVIFQYPNGQTSLNTHPDCCTSIGFTPEIGPEHYYICKWTEVADPTDCNNYESTGNFDGSGHMIFNYVTGGTTTILPNAQCCYDNNLIDELTSQGISCIESVADACGDLEVVSIPVTGYVTFYNPTTNSVQNTVPSLECCTSLGLNYVRSRDGIHCYNTLLQEVLTLTITNDSCCRV